MREYLEYIERQFFHFSTSLPLFPVFYYTAWPLKAWLEDAEYLFHAQQDQSGDPEYQSPYIPAKNHLKELHKSFLEQGQRQAPQRDCNEHLVYFYHLSRPPSVLRLVLHGYIYKNRAKPADFLQLPVFSALL